MLFISRWQCTRELLLYAFIKYSVNLHFKNIFQSSFRISLKYLELHNLLRERLKPLFQGHLSLHKSGAFTSRASSRTSPHPPLGYYAPIKDPEGHSHFNLYNITNYLSLKNDYFLHLVKHFYSSTLHSIKLFLFLMILFWNIIILVYSWQVSVMITGLFPILFFN